MQAISQNENTVIIDFDHTLFDTDAFLRAAALAAKQHGVSQALFYRTFAAITAEPRDAPYSFPQHIAAIAALTPVARSSLYKDFRQIVDRSSSFLYSDATAFLRNLLRWNVRVTLLTYADQKLRRAQLSSTSLSRWFDSVDIVSNSRAEKYKRLQEIAQISMTSILVDDHPKVLKAAEGFVTLRLRLRRRVLTRYRGIEPALPGVPVFRTLSDAYSFLLPILRTFGPVHRLED
jgi:FMN phosphatase YigB (HAD superfamily)